MLARGAEILHSCHMSLIKALKPSSSEQNHVQLAEPPQKVVLVLVKHV